MSKSTVITIVTHILSAFGAYLLGKNIFGHPADASTIQEITGGIMALISVGWGFVDGSVTIEAFQAALRQIITLAGGFLVGSGKASSDLINGILSIITLLAPFIYSLLSKKKSTQLVKGTLSAVDLKNNVKTPA